MAPYFEECQACLEDGIVADSDVLDAGMIFGTGFAPFRGGPMFYLAQKGQDKALHSIAESAEVDVPEEELNGEEEKKDE
jgi:3-hydroxyacyl-CoA dehydrogenase/enoyl-CoA hydratase/3-hydroxybutyryl-CoA epimerase